MKTLITLLILIKSTFAFAFDTYNASKGQLTIPSVIVGNTNYTNVVVNVGQVQNVFNTNPTGIQDWYNTNTNILTIPSVQVGNSTYSNVQVSVNKVISVGGSSNAYTSATPVPLNPNKFRIATIDWRFDMQSNYNQNGDMVMSFAATIPTLNQIKNAGFDTVLLQCDLPIDLTTGNLELFGPIVGGENGNKSLPADTWKVVDYAKSIGLRVALKMIPVDYMTDNSVSPDWSPLGINFSTNNFFNAINSYEVQVATIAQQHSVDLFYVGSFNNDFDTANFQTQWTNIVNNVRKVYSGLISYETDPLSPCILWTLVDLISVDLNYIFSTSITYDINQIINSYSNASYINGSNQLINNANVISIIQNLSKQYNKKIIIDGIFIDAGYDPSVSLPVKWTFQK